jgi:cellobiose transport system permease protein
MTASDHALRQAAHPGGAPPPAVGRREALRAWLHRLDVKGSPYLYVAPFFLIFAAFGLFPLGYTAYVSMNDWDLLDAGGHTWVGFDNYGRLFDDPYFWNALRNTLSIWVLSTVPQLCLALGLAHILNYRMRMRTFFRLAVVLPNVASVAAVAIIFAQLFGRDFGIVNWVLGLFGVENIDWRSSTLASHVAIASMVAWRWAGYNALIYLAAMQAIPGDLYEAAAIDGAGWWQQFRHVTIPMLRPTIIFTVILSTIGGFQLIAEPLLFDAPPGNTTGGSDRQFQTLGLLLYELGFREFRFGYASAVAWSLFLIIAVFAVVNYYLVSRRIRATD